ncbi:hypothetical protein IW140_003207 [Coemansia sp. RSA 1813]|nr:hypothetical protein LPJ74_002376 [Coemansia sp. RSA 1843]KAJ2569233.1 hypothetical protein IW140_003207 [Coemansia sp. RSA 1813]
MFTAKSTKVLALAFATLASISSAASPGCLSLKSSQSCPGFSHEFISTNATKRFSWYPKDNIEAFDKALLDYISGQANLDEFQSVFRCTGLDDLGGFNSDHGKAVIRYHRSIICADLIFGEDNINECYNSKPGNHNRRRDNEDDNNDSDSSRDGDGDTSELQLAQVLALSSASVVSSAPIPLCRSTCDAWIDSLHSIVTNSTLCQDNLGINREASLDSLRGKCKSTAYNGAPGHCVQGDENEPETCGYQRVEDWCKYCSDAVNYYDTCASVGVQVGRSNMDGSNGGSRLPAIPGINDKPPYNHLLSKLKKEERQERVFRIVAIVLSVIVGLCLVVLIILLTLGSKKPLPGMFLAKRGVHSNSSSSGDRGSGRDSKDDSTLLHLGGEGQNNLEKEGDFVDYFINVVGKPRQVLRHFFARRDDEISLHQGDIVTLQMAFDDGWVVGKNLTTGSEGTFPLMCVMDKLPATVPAQWSVLPESGGASFENLRRPPRTAAKPETPGQLAEQGYLGTHTSGGAFNSNISRMSNLSNTNHAVTTIAKLPYSPYQRSTRSINNSNSHLGSGMLVESEKPGKGWAILDRLRGAFAPGASGSAMGSDSDAGAPGFFKRLVTTSPLGREKPPAPELHVAKPGRPHSFNVNHVVHIGLTDPNYPRRGDLNTSVSTFPSTRQSANGYPMIVDRNSSSGRSRAQETQDPPAPGFPRQPNFSYGEFAPSSSSQMTTGNASGDTFHTAEQFVQSNLSQNAPFGAPGVTPRR